MSASRSSKVKKFAIELINAPQVYSPGQKLEGEVVLELAMNKTFKGILVQCVGKSHVYWKNGTGSDKATYFDEESYIKETKTLVGVGPRDEGEQTTLTPGTYNYPFSFTLPTECPGSFEGDYRCYVRYWLKAQMYKRWSLGKEVKLVFTVAGVLDLNTEDDVMRPRRKTASMTLCCLWCVSGPVSASFEIDRRGYVPGEWIVCNAKITDNSGSGFNSTQISLQMETTYTTKFLMPTHTVVRECATLVHGPVGRNGTDVWEGEKLLVPALPPSRLKDCKIISIRYYLRLYVNITRACRGLCLCLDIVIGSKPHREVLEQYNAQPDTIVHQPMGLGAAANIDHPPPSYQECVFGRVNTRDDEDQERATGNLQFAPSYMYYDWLRPYQRDTDSPPPPYSSL